MPDEHVRGNEPAGSVERGLSERKQAGKSEDQIDAEAEESQDEDARAEIGARAEEPEQKRKEHEKQRDRAFNPPAGAIADGPENHARPTTPSNPCGRTSSTSAIAM